MVSDKYITVLLLIKLLLSYDNNVRFHSIFNDSFISDKILIYAYNSKSLNYFFYTVFEDNNSNF